MPTTTSLLRSAESTRRKIAEQEDALVAFNWSNSAKTIQDFKEYSKYLDSRRELYAGDPSKLLSLEKNKVSARKAYVSNEIQRQNIAIVEGRANSQTKYDKLVDLFYEAVDNGDYDLAQTLNLQLDNLSVKIQQEAQSAATSNANALATASSDNYKVIKKMISSLEDKVGYVTLPNGNEYPGLKEISNQLEQTGKFTLADGTEMSPFQAAEETIKAIAEMTVNQYENAPDQDEVDKLESKYGAGLENLYDNIKFNVGGKDLTARDVVIAKENELINNPIYSYGFKYDPTTGKRSFELIENKVDRYEIARQINPDTGEEEYIPVGLRNDVQPRNLDGSDRKLDTKITNEGYFIGDNGNIDRGSQQVETNDQQTLKARLQAAGYEIDVRPDGEIIIAGKGLIPRQATVQPNGNIRYFDDNGQLIELSTHQGTQEVTDENGQIFTQPFNAGDIRPVNPEEVSPFAEVSLFGTGYFSQRSKEGAGYLSNFQGRTPTITGKFGPIGVGNTNNDFARQAGFTPLTTNLLQGAQDKRLQITQENEAKKKLIQLQAQRDAANKLQQATIFNLNQTPVARVANRQVVKPALLGPQPRVTVRPSAPAPKVTVKPSAPQPKVYVKPQSSYMTIPGVSF